MSYDFSSLKKRGEEIKDWFKQEAASLRTGRANPALVENILIDTYGAKTPLKHVASISAEDARTLRISPWDASSIKSIEVAISASNLGAQPIADGQSVRVSLPELTDERRKILAKSLSAKLEESKISLRQERDKIWKDIQEKEKDGEISEDDKFRFKDEMQKIVDGISDKLEETAKTKEKEIIG
ncbi:TPA: ribosome recycling factor [Patescibacteria group bacterium]|nr:MAG: Ribosome-recycling factor [Parcubacteria group bacterium GW2011_GWF2_40_10]KKR46996.1 MAG: Ribosome-recycling factor [Parcubacteria group bacterium GW2011_GWA2_40_143]KKR59193.1 MAG: Ribosome-recycling factor [Parcubacteria group bacterium GW2011_GWC2_40_31]KKR74866.1 MAG: Ribosome-recycling factor [Parcubacteria group bacterium GW2011_GWB2_40_8]KKR82320.1 MAG: Ribosome-recycling factor [Parcubacteria group bacterium GW2011_GWD2_40_9]HBB56521.1 ribosome recycling factor [Patescibacteri